MAVDRVMAQIGPAADEPARKRRIRAVEHHLERRFPMDAPRFVAPEVFRGFDGTAVELAVTGHRRRSFLRYVVSERDGACPHSIEQACRRGQRGFTIGRVLANPVPRSQWCLAGSARKTKKGA